MTGIRELANFITQLKLEDVPQNVQNSVKLHVLDSIGAALGASGDELVRHVEQTYFKVAGDSQAASCWGQNKKVPLLTAIFLNAMMGHRLELDDVHTKSKTHIGTVVVPAAWSLSEYLHKTGKEFLEAVISGYETMSRIGMGFGVSSHRNKGWHVTATAGTFGAAAAAAKLLKLDEDKTVSALGMAGTQSFGLWAFLNDGASCKILHPARAAASGTEAALLSYSGMTGPEHILDAKDGGLYAAMSDEYDLNLVSKDLGKKYELMDMDNKPYPCCRSTHCAIDAALAIRKDNKLSAGDIDHVEIKTYLVGYKQCGVSGGSLNPVTPVDAKFSTPYTVACAFVYGKVALDQFKQAKIGNPEVQELLRKVKVFPEERFTNVYPNHWGCTIKVWCKNGKILEKDVSDASGSVANPLTEEQVVEKARNLMTINHHPSNNPELIKVIMQMDKIQELPQL